MSKLTRVSILLAAFFAIDKALGFFRLIVVARQFKLTPEYAAFNVANNVPDLLFALISGGAMAMAIIPALTEALTKEGRPQAWELFSKIANFAFLVTAGLAIVIGLLAEPMMKLWIAPGFTPEQQALTIDLMRLDLIATLIFSLSGLVMGGLQANQHFFLPALAPILYNLGQLMGALILAPEKGYSFGPLHLPAYGMGIHGLVYGVIIGAVLHLLIQVPGLLRYGFRWSPRLGLNTEPVRRVLSLLGPRVLTMFFIQLTFIVRDNLASRLDSASVSALTLGYSLTQIPETLIGTVIGIAILPTLSELIARDQREAYQATLQRAMQVIVAITIPLAVLMGVGLRPLLQAAFHYSPAETDLLLWSTRGFLVGLTGQCLVEVAVRSFYARRDARTPLYVAGVFFLVYTALGILLFRTLGAPGISLGDSLAFTIEAIILLVLLNRQMIVRIAPEISLPRALLGALIGGMVVFAAVSIAGEGRLGLLIAAAGLAVGGAVSLLPVWKEVRMLLKL